MRFLSFAVLAVLVTAVSVHAADKEKDATKKPLAARADVVGNLVCSKCEFKTGKCAAGLKAGDLQVLLNGDAARELFKLRCSGAPKVATGALTRFDGNTVYLYVSRIVDPEVPTGDKQTTDSPEAKND